MYPTSLNTMCGRAAYNDGPLDRADLEEAKAALLERVDVLTPGGKGRLRQIRGELGAITDKVVETLPGRIDVPSGRFFSRNAERGASLALAGQRVYIGGLDRADIERDCHGKRASVRPVPQQPEAPSPRNSPGSSTFQGCDLLTGVCLMAGPVNQNDIGKQLRLRGLLAGAHPGKDLTSPSLDAEGEDHRRPTRKRRAADESCAQGCPRGPAGCTPRGRVGPLQRRPHQSHATRRRAHE